MRIYIVAAHELTISYDKHDFKHELTIINMI